MQAANSNGAGVTVSVVMNYNAPAKVAVSEVPNECFGKRVYVQIDEMLASSVSKLWAGRNRR